MKVTFEDKEGIIPYGTRINQVQDRDLNEIKLAINTNDDQLQEIAAELDSVLLDSFAISNPTIPIPVEVTGNAHCIGVGPGTYAFWGGMVIPANNIGTLKRVDGIYSVNLTPIVFTEYLKILDGNKINPWTAKSYLSGDQVNHLGLDWVANAATVAGDVPGISNKWVDRLTGYAKTDFNPFVLNITGDVITADVLKKFILGIEITSVAANPALFYSPAIFSKNSTTVSISIYSSINTTGTGYVLVKTFTSRDILNKELLINNGGDYILIDPTAIPEGSYTGYTYTKAGFQQAIFKKNNSVLISNKKNEVIDITGGLTFIADKYIDTNGNMQTAVNYSSSEKFTVNPLGNYYLTFGFINLGTFAIVAYYDASGVFISSYNQNTGTPLTFLTKYKLPIPLSCKLIAITKHSTSTPCILESDSYTNSLNSSIALQPINVLEKVNVSEILIFKSGFYVDILGKVIANASFKITEIVINAKGNYYLTLSFVGTGNYSIIAYYDASGVFISSYAQTSGAPVITMINYKLVVPTNAAFATITTTTATVVTFVTDNFSLFTTLNKPVLSTKNQFVIPNFIDVAVNKDCNIYLDCISKNSNFNNKSLLIEGDVAVKRTESFIKYKPTAVAASIPVKFIKTDLNYIEQYSRTTNLRSVPITGGAGVTKRIMLVGDSLTDNEYLAQEMFVMLGNNLDFTPIDIGTRGTAKKHEGRGSWRWSDYIAGASYAGKTNAFWIGGKLDFQAYCTNNSFAGLDYVIIQLGTNDVGQGTTMATPTSIATIINNSKVFIDALLHVTTGFPACKIAIALPSVGSPESDTSRNMNVYRNSIQMLNQAYVDTYDNGIYNPNVTCLASGLWINRNESYPFTDVQSSDRIIATERVFTDAVHPLPVGYYQWADAYYSKIRAFLSGLL